MSTPNIEESLLDSIGSADLSSLVADFSEVGLDMLLEEGFVRDIPIIGSLLKLSDAAISLRNRLFAKKLLLFLNRLSTVPLEKRRAHVERLGTNEKERRKTGETLLLLLDRMNDMSKPAMMANAFKAYLEDHIAYKRFKELAFAVDAINITTIDTLKDAYQSEYSHETMTPSLHVQHLAMCGLFSLVFNKIETGVFVNGGSESDKPAGAIRKNEFGRQFCEIVLQLPTK